jgi:hypothetical protein
MPCRVRPPRSISRADQRSEASDLRVPSKRESNTGSASSLSLIRWRAEQRVLRFRLRRYGCKSITVQRNRPRHWVLKLRAWRPTTP